MLGRAEASERYVGASVLGTDIWSVGIRSGQDIASCDRFGGRVYWKEGGMQEQDSKPENFALLLFLCD